VPMVVIDLECAPPKLYGQLSRRMLEVRPGVFVAALSRRSFLEIWQAVEISGAKSALAVYQAKTELGIDFKTIGQHRYQIVDNFGLPLISTRKSARTKNGSGQQSDS